MRDARENKPTFLRAVAFHPEQRRDLLRYAWKDIGNAFLVGVIMDVVYQLIALRWLYPNEAIIVAFLLALIPYVLVRTVLRRLVGQKKEQPCPTR